LKGEEGGNEGQKKKSEVGGTVHKTDKRYRNKTEAAHVSAQRDSFITGGVNRRQFLIGRADRRSDGVYSHSKTTTASSPKRTLMKNRAEGRDDKETRNSTFSTWKKVRPDPREKYREGVRRPYTRVTQGEILMRGPTQGKVGGERASLGVGQVRMCPINEPCISSIGMPQREQTRNNRMRPVSSATVPKTRETYPKLQKHWSGTTDWVMEKCRKSREGEQFNDQSVGGENTSLKEGTLVHKLVLGKLKGGNARRLGT